MSKLRLILWLLAALQLAYASEHDKLSALIDQEWQYQLETFPEFATAIGDNRYNDRLADNSAAAVAKREAHDKSALSAFEAIDASQLKGDDALNLMLIKRRLATDVAGARFKEWEMPVNQMNGAHLSYAGISKEMPFNNVHDYENYLARLHAMPKALEQITENMRLGMRDGLMPPRYLLEKVGTEAGNIASQPLEQSLFTDPVRHFPNGISEADKARLGTQVRQVVSKEVFPAYAAFAKFVQSEYAPKGRTEYGVWSLPEGKARYQQNIQENTASDSSPSELHELGLKQVVQIEAQMLTIAKQQGFSDVKTFNHAIFENKKLYGTSGAQVLALYQHYADQMYQKLPQYFGKLPKNKLVVTPMEEFRAPDGVPADYSIGAGDGSRPGRINVNEYDPTHRLLLNSEAIAYHEGVPGHHLQFSIAQELKDIPPFRKFGGYSAYSEGWALYTETLAHEMGFYQDPYSEYGRLQNLMWRSIRLVVDTGVHSQHWSRQQMIDFFHDHTAMDEQNIESEVDRYIAWPGQALSYKLGEMTILRMREKARAKLGAKFDIRAFHDAVLGKGPLPLDVLESYLNEWIEAQAKRL
jgi:uncharacterized protein (DUF885 family)